MTKRYIILALLVSGLSQVALGQFNSIRVDVDHTYAAHPSGGYNSIPSSTTPLGGLGDAFAQSISIGDAVTGGSAFVEGRFSHALMTGGVSGSVTRRASVGSGIHYRFTVDYPVTATVTYAMSRQGIVWWDRTVVYLTDITGGYHVFYKQDVTEQGQVTVQLVPNHTYTFNVASNRNNLDMFSYPEAWGTDYAFADLMAHGCISFGLPLGDYVGNALGTPVTVKILQGGTVLQTIETTMNQHQQVAVSTPLRGTYDLWVKASHWLGTTTPNVTITDEGVFPNVNQIMVNGDVNGDNEVGPVDFAELAYAFGSEVGDPLYRVVVDLDGNEEVGPSDFSILATHFGTSGE